MTTVKLMSSLVNLFGTEPWRPQRNHTLIVQKRLQESKHVLFILLYKSVWPLQCIKYLFMYPRDLINIEFELQCNMMPEFSKHFSESKNHHYVLTHVLQCRAQINYDISALFLIPNDWSPWSYAEQSLTVKKIQVVKTDSVRSPCVNHTKQTW